jgi:hypothetical protein
VRRSHTAGSAAFVLLIAFASAGGGCAAISAARQTALARDAIALEGKRGVRARGPEASRVYNLTLASELLDKARQQAAKGRFQSAADLAREAHDAARQANVRGDDA